MTYVLSSASLLCRIRFLTLSSGETHPLARDTPTLEYTRTVPENPDIHWSYSIRVSGNYLGILVINNEDDDDGDGNELIVWNWKTGARNLVNERLYLLLYPAHCVTIALEFDIGQYVSLHVPRRRVCSGRSTIA